MSITLFLAGVCVCVRMCARVFVSILVVDSSPWHLGVWLSRTLDSCTPGRCSNYYRSYAPAEFVRESHQQDLIGIWDSYATPSKRTPRAEQNTSNPRE